MITQQQKHTIIFLSVCFCVFMSVFVKAKPKLSTFTIQVPVDQDEFLQEAAQVLCNSKIGVIRLAIARLKNSKFLEEAQRLAVEEAGLIEGAGREVAMQG